METPWTFWLQVMSLFLLLALMLNQVDPVVRINGVASVAILSVCVLAILLGTYFAGRRNKTPR